MSDGLSRPFAVVVGILWSISCLVSWNYAGAQTPVACPQAGGSGANAMRPQTAEDFDGFGVTLLKSHDATCALEFFQKALVKDPQALLPRYHEAIAYQSLANYAEAAKDYQIVLQQKEDFADAHIGLGEAEESQGQSAAAEANYRRALSLTPKSSQAAAHLASVLEKEGQQPAAIRYWTEALASDPSNRSVQFSLALAYLNDSQNEQAAQLFAGIVKQQPDSGDAAIDLGTALSREGRFTEAVEAYQRALTIPAVHDVAAISLAKALIALLRYPEADKYLAPYVAIHPKDSQAHMLTGMTDRGLGNVAAAELELSRAVELDSRDYDAQYNYGAVLRQDHKDQDAIAHLKAAVALKPDSTEAHYQLSRAYYATHQTELAAREEAILREQQQATATATRVAVLGNQALSALDRQDLQGAAENYKEILQLAPADAKTYYQLAMVYDKLNDRAQERELLEKANRLDPSLAYVHSQLGYLAMLAGNTDIAELEFKRALKVDARSVQALGNLGVLYARAGQTDQAAHLLRLATDNDPQYATGYLNLGLILAAQGQYTEAIQELQRSIAIAPHDNTANQALEQVRLQMAAKSGTGK